MLEEPNQLKVTELGEIGYLIYKQSSLLATILKVKLPVHLSSITCLPKQIQDQDNSHIQTNAFQCCTNTVLYISAGSFHIIYFVKVEVKHYEDYILKAVS